jgi:actin related protein 2/3 complex, subunit 3
MQLSPLAAGESDLTIDAAHESYDPLDEVLSLFRANTFFRNFEIKGPADRVLIYGILFVQEILGKIKSSRFLFLPHLRCDGCVDIEETDDL